MLARFKLSRASTAPAYFRHRRCSRRPCPAQAHLQHKVRRLCSSGRGGRSHHGGSRIKYGAMASTGTLVGFFCVHTGLAGSVVALPILYSRFSGMKTALVTGTVLAATTVSAASGAGAYYLKSDHVDLTTVGVLGGSGAFASALGSLASARVKPQLVKRACGVALLIIAPVIALSRRRGSAGGSSPSDSRASLLAMVPIGFAAGMMQGALAIGGGLIMTTLMSLTTTMDQHSIIASTLGSSALINTSATLMHYRMGNVHVPAALAIFATPLRRLLLRSQRSSSMKVRCEPALLVP